MVTDGSNIRTRNLLHQVSICIRNVRQERARFSSGGSDRAAPWAMITMLGVALVSSKMRNNTSRGRSTNAEAIL